MLILGVTQPKTAKSKCNVCKKDVIISDNFTTGYSYKCLCGHGEELGKMYCQSWEGSSDRLSGLNYT